MFIYPSNSRDLGLCYAVGRPGSCRSWVIRRKIGDRSCGSLVMRRKTALDTRILEFSLASCHGIQGSWILFNDHLMDLADLLTPPGFSRWNVNDRTYRCKSFSTLSDINVTSSNKISEKPLRNLIGAGRNCSVWPERSSVQKEIVSLMSFPKHWWLLVAMEEMCRISAD